MYIGNWTLKIVIVSNYMFYCICKLNILNMTHTYYSDHEYVWIIVDYFAAVN